MNESDVFGGPDLEKLYGPVRDSLYIVVPMTAIYAVIFCAGLVGNVSTCIVIIKNKSMHTATNYYLCSLAISDLLLLVFGLPPEIYSMWSRYPYVFGYTFCVLRGLFAETSANATILTITAFTVERYVAICHPFLSYTMSKLSRVIKLIMAIWIIAICFAVPQALQLQVITNYTTLCEFTSNVEYSLEFSTIVFFVLPMTAITVLYVMIALRLRASDMMKRNAVDQTIPSMLSQQKLNCRHQQGQYSRRVLKMLVAVVVAFFICWAPFHTQRLVALYVPFEGLAEHSQYLKIYEVVTYISGILYFMSTMINPLLYNIMSNKFREAFKETFASCFRVVRFQREKQERSYSVLSRVGQRGYESTDFGGDYNSVQTNISKISHDICLHPSGRRLSNSTRKTELTEFDKSFSHNHGKEGNGDTKENTASKSQTNSLCKCFNIFTSKEKDSHVHIDTARNSTSEVHAQFLAHHCRRKRASSYNISNSSLKEVELADLEDELSSYVSDMQHHEEI